MVAVLTMAVVRVQADDAEKRLIDAAQTVAVSPLFEVAAFLNEPDLFERFGPSVVLIQKNEAGADRQYLLVFQSGDLKLMRFSRRRIARSEEDMLFPATYTLAVTSVRKVSAGVASDLMFLIRAMVLTQQFKIESAADIESHIAVACRFCQPRDIRWCQKSRAGPFSLRLPTCYRAVTIW